MNFAYIKNKKLHICLVIAIIYCVTLFLPANFIYAWDINSYKNKSIQSEKVDSDLQNEDVDENLATVQDIEEIEDAESLDNLTNEAQSSDEVPYKDYVYRDFDSIDQFFGDKIARNYYGIWAIENIIKVNKDGSADVKEIWRTRADSSQGSSEVYVAKNFRDLGFDEDSFKVSARIGDSSRERILSTDDLVDFNMESAWDPHGSFDDKAYKYGINRVDDNGNIELCVGITEYNTDMTYYLSYHLNTFLNEYTDDVIGTYVRVINDRLNPSPKYTSTYIYSDDFVISGENSRIWAFGIEAYAGSINDNNHLIAKNGKLLGVVSEKNKYIDGSHVTFLMTIKDPNVTAMSQGYKSFEDVKEEAFVGSDYDNGSADYGNSGAEYSGESPSPINWDKVVRKSSFTRLLKNLPFFIWVLFPFIVFFAMNFAVRGPRLKNGKMVKYKNKPSSMPPFNSDSLFIYYLSTQVKLPHGLAKSEMDASSYFSALLLSWIKEQCLLPITPTKSNGKKAHKKTSLVLISTPKEFKYEVDEKYWNILVNVAEESGENKITVKSLNGYFEDHNKNANSLINKCNNLAIEYLKLNGYVRGERRKLYLTEEGIKEGEQLLAFEDFIKNYSLLSQREAYEAQVWDNLLIAATACSYGELALEQMRNLIPEYQFAADQSSVGAWDAWDTYYLLRLTNNMGYSATQGIKNNSSNSNGFRSGGGGGFSSIGGGSSGFSGGSSGGGFR